MSLPAEMVATGWSPAGWREYAERCIASFDRYWPWSVSLACYVEEHVRIARGTTCLIDDCPGLREFIDRHRDNPEANGRGAPGTRRGRYRYKGNGYSFAFDAVRFSRQAFIPERAARYQPDGTILAWMDADVLTVRQVPAGFVAGLVGDADVARIARDGQASELGFWAVRLSSATRRFLTAFADAYRSDAIFDLPEWHSGFVFDRYLADSGLTVRDLTGRGGIRRGHVWFNTPLAEYTDHLKGMTRKQLGQSPERPR